MYGFGSFFRKIDPNDCDLLLVVKDDCPDLGFLHAELSKQFYRLGKKISIELDLTILTEREHEKKPLCEHNKLVPIFQIKKA